MSCHILTLSGQFNPPTIVTAAHTGCLHIPLTFHGTGLNTNQVCQILSSTHPAGSYRIYPVMIAQNTSCGLE